MYRLGLLNCTASDSSQVGALVTQMYHHLSQIQQRRKTEHFQAVPFVQAAQIHRVHPKKKQMKDMRSEKIN